MPVCSVDLVSHDGALVLHTLLIWTALLSLRGLLIYLLTAVSMPDLCFTEKGWHLQGIDRTIDPLEEIRRSNWKEEWTLSPLCVFRVFVVVFGDYCQYREMNLDDDDRGARRLVVVVIRPS